MESKAVFFSVAQVVFWIYFQPQGGKANPTIEGFSGEWNHCWIQ